MKTKLFEYNYTPLINIFESDFIDLDKAKEYIPFGDDNLIPQQIILLSRSVAIHRSILNSKTFYISANGFTSDDQSLNNFINICNIHNESLKDVIFKVLFDELNIGNSYIELVTDKNKSFLSLYHIDGSKCRLKSDLQNIIIHPDWTKYKGKHDKLSSEIPLYPSFKKNKHNLYHSAIHIKQYEPEFFHYGLPSWYAGLSSVIIAGLTDIWNQNRLTKEFNSSGLLVIPGVNSDEDALSLNTEFDKYKGANSENSNKLIIQYLKDLGPGQSREVAQFLEFKTNNESNWIELHNQAHSNLLSIHNWFKSLSSFFGEKTGFDTQRIINEYEIALSTTIRQYQDKYISIINRLLTDFNFNTESLKFSNESPVYRINPVKYVWEVRRDLGLEYDINDPKQKLFYSELKNKFTTDSNTSLNDESNSTNEND